MGSALSSKFAVGALPTEQLQEIALKEKKRKRGNNGYELLSKSESQSASARTSTAFQSQPEDTVNRSVFSKRRRHGENGYTLLDGSSGCEGDTCKKIDKWSGGERSNLEPDDQSRPISMPGLWKKNTTGRVKHGGDLMTRKKATLFPVSFNVPQPSILLDKHILTTSRNDI